MFMLVKLIPDINNWSKEKPCQAAPSTYDNAVVILVEKVHLVVC
jgi:hypothetical protein